MEIEIIQQQCGGTEFLAQPHRLHLGAQNAEGVDQMHFILPDVWAGCTLALYLRRRDGMQLAPIPLDAGNCVTVDRRLTGSTGGQWMLAAVQGEHYTAYTRPGSYDVYATLPTDGGSEDLPPSLYEQFVAQVLESARTAADNARRAEAGAADTAIQAALAQSAADKILADRTDAAACAQRAEAAALRAEAMAPAAGAVQSVNGKGGAVQLDAMDVHAVPCPAQPLPGELVRILSTDPTTGTVQTDTTPLPDLHPYVRSDVVPTKSVSGAVRADPQYGITVRGDATLTIVPATTGQLDAMTERYTPLTLALLPYGVKKALTSAATAGEWSEQEKAAALLQLGADAHFYSKAEADRKFGAPYTLPPATTNALGGVKVGSGLSIGTDGTLALTAADLNRVLGFSPAPAQLPYRIVYDHSYVGTGKPGTQSSPIQIPLAANYDAIAVIKTEVASYPEGRETTRQRVLLELVTQEAAYHTFKQNYLCLQGLPSTTFTAADKINSGLIVLQDLWNPSDLYLRYKNRTLELYVDDGLHYLPVGAWNDAAYQYHVFGITLDSSVLPAVKGGTT